MNTISLTISGAADFPPKRIGEYEVLEFIGEGGMGMVFSVRKGPTRAVVALKTTKFWLDVHSPDGKAAAAHLKEEYDFLSKLRHESFPKVYDYETLPDGRQFFTLELLRGENILEYCDNEILSVEKRSELFLLVCDAVQHAHSKGIIHRDLKTKNILVVKNGGGAPIPKILDFGIAKTTTPDDPGQSYASYIDHGERFPEDFTRDGRRNRQ